MSDFISDNSPYSNSFNPQSQHNGFSNGFLFVFQRTKLSFTKIKRLAHSHMLLRAGIGLDPNNMDLELESEL